MSNSLHLCERPEIAALRQEIQRFVETTRRRSEPDGERRLRKRHRHHRSWPLEVAVCRARLAPTQSVALHNASPRGVSFLVRKPLLVGVGGTVYIKLFICDDRAPRVPAVIRHVTPFQHGFLIGCEFDLPAGGDGTTAGCSDQCLDDASPPKAADRPPIWQP